MADQRQQSQIEDIKSKIERNEKIRDKAKELRNVLEDKNAQAQCETQIKESERYVDYLNSELQLLQEQASTSTSAIIDQASNSSGAKVSLSSNGTSIGESSLPSDKERRKTKRTSLDLLKSDIPINRKKVVKMLREMEYRLHTEERVKQEIMERIQNDSRGSQGDIQQRLVDSQEKIKLLKRAVRKYQSLDIVDAPVSPSESETPSFASEKVPLPAAGMLRLKIAEANQLTHAPSHTFPMSQTFVAVQVNGRRKNKTRSSRDDTWSDTFEMDVNKASEIQLVIYDRAGDRTLPIGLVWLKMIDIAEDLRQKKKRMLQKEDVDCTKPSPSVVISDWFDVEPTGRIYLQLSFVRKGAKIIPFNKLKRSGAIRELEGKVDVSHGHKFVSKRFYQILRCSVCRDFNVNITYQCEDCHLSCHKNCYDRVPSRCLARESISPVDEGGFKYNIPHRFETIMVIGTNWCSHCGLILPLAVKNVKKCTECGAMYHAKCCQFVPNYCGIDMETAYRLGNEFRSANEHRRSLLPREEIPGEPYSPLPPHDVQVNRHSMAWPLPSSSIERLQTENVRHSFHNLSLGQSVQMTQAELLQQNPTRYSSMTPLHMNRGASIDDFNFLAVLGRGNFGKVLLAENKYTRQLYAIKALKKLSILMQNDFKCILAEKEVFMVANQTKHPFLVNLHSTFMTESRLFFVMEYVAGGDLMLHIQGQNFSEPRARFYSAEVLLALEHLHDNGIIYRDLKLDNVVLAPDGHIKLTDYGLCKGNTYHETTTGTYCGTPEFMAPEILMNQRYTRAVDWWAFGVLLYEMLAGQAPFRAETEDEMFDAIMRDELVCPHYLSKEAKSLLHALLQKDPSHRLGSGRDDAMEIRSHVFYDGVRWDDLLAKRVTAPFIPTLRGRADTSNFDAEFTGEFPVLTPVPTQLSREEQQQFHGFEYISEWALD